MRARRVLALVFVLALVVTACGDDDATTTTAATTTTTAASNLTQTPGVLLVGSDVPYPPFEDFDADGNVIGYDADIMTEIATRLGLEIEWVDTDFDTIFTQLATGRFDAVISASTITPDRAAQVNFTVPYYKSQQAFTVNTALTPGLANTDGLVSGDTVAVQTGTTGADWAATNLAPNGIEVREFAIIGDAYNAVEAGQVTGVVSDEPSAVAEIANREDIAIVQVIDTNENYGIAVDPERTELLAAINAAFADMLEDGTYQAIYDTWFEAPAGSVLYDPRADWPEAVVFGFVPSQEAGELQDEIDTFAAILSDALGIEVTGIVSTDYTALGVALGTGQVQMGAFGPAGYVLASRNYDNLELLAQSVRFGDATYHAQWYTNDPSICGAEPVEGAFYYDADGNVVPVGPTETPASQVGWNRDGTRDDAVSAGLACPEPVDLSVVVGKTIAFPGETSTSGYIFPTIQLINAGITDDQYESLFFGGSHDLAVTAVYNGDAEIGLSFDDARRSVRETFPDVGEKIIVFNISPRIANDVIAVSADLPQTFKDAVFAAMAGYIATDEGAVVMEQLYSWTDLTRADAATLASLEPIGDAIDELGFGS